MGLFKKKKNLEPPLPDDLGDLGGNSSAPAPSAGNPQSISDLMQHAQGAELTPETPGMAPEPMPPSASDVHSQIPNDFPPPENLPEEPMPPVPDMGADSKLDHHIEASLAPQNLPEPEMPAPGPVPAAAPSPDPTFAALNTEAVPNQGGIQQLPPASAQPQSQQLPDLEPIASLPNPEVDDEVPKPPAIFSEDGFYETPEEVSHLVEDGQMAHPTGYRPEMMQEEHPEKEIINKYNLSEMDEAHSEIVEDDIEKPAEMHRQGPLFVNIESFRTMLGDIDEIKTRLKTSTDIMQSLNEIKQSKDRELERWRVSVEDLQKKLMYVDNVLFKNQ